MGHALQILLVEDHRDTVTVFTRVLKSFGHQVWTAATIAQAMALFAQREFDLLIIDLRLPDGAGTLLLRKARRAGVISPAIAFTADAYERDKAHANRAGFAVYLTKPASLEQLEQAITDAMAHSFQPQ